MLRVQLSCSQCEYSKEGQGLHLHEDPQGGRRKRRDRGRKRLRKTVWRENFIGLGGQEGTGSFEKTVPPRKKEGTISQRLR